MPSFRYRALAEDGSIQQGELSAKDSRAAIEELRTRSLSAFDLSAVGRAQQSELARRPFWSSGATPKRALLDTFHQLASLLKAGLPLLVALQTLRAGVEKSRLNEQISALESDLRGGKSFSEALSQRFPELAGYVARYAELGMRTGRLGQGIEDAIERMRFEDEVRREISSAVAYPIFLLSAGLAVAVFLFTSVLPRFATMIKGAEDKVPGFAKALIDAGIWLQANSWLALALGGAAVVCVVSLFRAAAMRQAAFSAASRLPWVGPAIIVAEWATWTRVMGGALKYGAHMTTALDVAWPSVRLPAIKQGLTRAARKIRAGQHFEDALQQEAGADPLITNMSRTGRITGRLAEMLLFVSDRYEQDTRARIKQLTSLAEPLAIVFVAGLIGIIVVAVVLTISSVYDVIS